MESAVFGHTNMKQDFRTRHKNVSLFVQTTMKNQKTIFLLASLTTGIIMVLFVVDFVLPRRRPAGSMRLIGSSRASLFGRRTDPQSKPYSSKKKTDKMDILMEKLEQVTKKVDKVIEMVNELGSERNARPIVIPKHSEDTDVVDKHERMPGAGKSSEDTRSPSGASGKLVTPFTQLYRPNKKREQDGVVDGPSSSGHGAVGGLPSSGYSSREILVSKPVDRTSSNVPSDLKSVQADVTKDKAEGMTSSNFERLIGELLNENLDETTEVPVPLSKVEVKPERGDREDRTVLRKSSPGNLGTKVSGGVLQDTKVVSERKRTVDGGSTTGSSGVGKSIGPTVSSETPKSSMVVGNTPFPHGDSHRAEPSKKEDKAVSRPGRLLILNDMPSPKRDLYLEESETSVNDIGGEMNEDHSSSNAGIGLGKEKHGIAESFAKEWLGMKHEH